MKDTNIVCDCADITVADVKAYIEKTNNQNKSLDEQLEELRIATGCRMCEDKDCSRIDTHYSEIIK